MKHGLRERCPSCGQGALFSRYLKVVDTCSACGEALHHHRADDAPPYVVILVLGHIIIPIVTGLEIAFTPPMWVHLVTAIPLTVGLALWLLPKAKGLIIGIQWANRMHGFGGEAAEGH